MISALVLGELIADPIERRTSTGKPFATVTVKSGAGGESVLIGLATFSETAVSKLLQLRKGDSIAATGTLEANVWTDKKGNERRGWRLTASAVLTAYEAGKRRKHAHEAVEVSEGHHEADRRLAGAPAGQDGAFQ